MYDIVKEISRKVVFIKTWIATLAKTLKYSLKS